MRKGCTRGFKVTLIILGILVFGYLLLVGVGAVLIVADPVEPVDAVVVLSGDAEGDRLALAVQMHAQGLAPHLVITSTERAANLRLKGDAIDAGFPESAIIITEQKVASTADEARAVRALAQDRGWDTLMVVTDPYHSFRARFIFRQELGGAGITVYVRPIVGHWFRSPSWFLHPEGWIYVFLEVTKFSAYLLGLR